MGFDERWEDYEFLVVGLSLNPKSTSSMFQVDLFFLSK